jgi:hypothetical protein
MKYCHGRLDQSLIKLLIPVLAFRPHVFEHLVALEEILGIEKPKAFQVLCRVFCGHLITVPGGDVVCLSVTGSGGAKSGASVGM